MHILVLNCRIHSVEFELFVLSVDNGKINNEKKISSGVVDKIGSENPGFAYRREFDGREISQPVTVIDHHQAIEFILQTLVNPELGVLKSTQEIDAVGHRVVHGGDKYAQSVIISPEVKQVIYDNFELAPLHNPYNFRGIETINKLLSGTPQVAVFDTSFHQTIPDFASRYPLPNELSAKYRIRRYGFHGISHRYVAERTANYLGISFDKLTMISLHLGAGASLCAIKNGQSFDTTMGFTPMEGVMMTTRAGDIDPGIIFYLYRAGWTIHDIETNLNLKSGTLGVSTISEEMKEVVNKSESNDKSAKLAVAMYVYRIRKYLGAYFTILNSLPGEPVQAIGFTGGIGENSDLIRGQVCESLGFIGIKIDTPLNQSVKDKEIDIAKKNAKVRVLVIPGDEKLLIARDTAILVSSQK